MTTPGGVPNLPKGALTIANLASRVQDMTPAAMRTRATERFSSIFTGSTGGDPAVDVTPFGILTQLFAGFNSQVANADPADIQGPDDLPALLLDFITSLPVVGEFVGLLDAILGTYQGDDETLNDIQKVFAVLRALFDGVDFLASPSPEDAWTQVANQFLHDVFATADSMGALLNALFDASNGSTGSTGKTIAQVFGALQGQRSSIGTAQSTANTASTNANSALSQLASLLSGMGLPTIAALVSSLQGTASTAANAQATASNAQTNANSALSQFSSLLSGMGLSTVAALVSSLQGTASTASSASTTATSAQNSTSRLFANLASFFGGSVDVAPGSFNPATLAVPTTRLTGTIGEGLTGLNTLRDSLINGLFGGTTGSNFTNQQATNQGAVVAQNASAALAAAAVINASLSGSSVPPGGLNKAIRPAGADGSAVSSSDFSGPTTGDVVIRANNYLGIRDSNGLGTFYATVNGTATTDDQSIEITLGDNGSWNGAATYMLFHSDTGNTVGAYCRVVNDSIAFGSYTRSGSTWTFTPFSGGQYSTSLSGGTRVRARNTGTTYTAEINGNTAFSVTNSSVTFGATRRTFHVALQRAYSNGFYGWGAQNYDSFRIASVIASDYVAVAVPNGAELVRTNTAVVQSSVASTRFPDNFFNASRNVSSDIVADPVKGRFTVSKSRYYEVSFRAKAATYFDILPLEHAIFKGSGGSAVLLDKRIGTGFASGADPPIIMAVSGSCEIWLNAGDYIELGYIRTGGGGATNTWVGTSDGLSTYFQIVGAN